MSEEQENPLSPTVSNVLYEYLAKVEVAEEIYNEAVKPLDTLLRQGKVAKFEAVAREGANSRRRATISAQLCS